MKKAVLFIFCLFLITSVYSEQWQVLGTRAMGMGGAYVAMAKGPVAQYWNPAGLAQKSTETFNGLEISAGAGIEATGGILDNVTKITDAAQELDKIRASENSSQKLSPQEISAFMKTLASLEDINRKDSGALVEIAGGVNIKLSKLAFSVNNFTTVGLNPWVDTKNIGITNTSAGSNIDTSNTTQPSDPTLSQAADNLEQAITVVGFTNVEKILCGGGTGCLSGVSSAEQLANALVNYAASNGVNSQDILNASQEALNYADEAAPVFQNYSGVNFSNNTSNVDVDAASFNEAAIGYAKYVNFLPGLAIGGNLKIIQGQIASKKFEFLNSDDTGDAFKDFLDNKETSVKPALDIGFLWNVNEKFPKIPFKPRVGLTIRNINSPKFDAPYGGEYQLDRQVRMGIALSPFNWWHFAFDMDLTENDTLVDGFKSRQIAFGTEINILNKKSFNLPLRLGIMKNIAESDSSTMYTAGLGLTFAYIHFEVAAGISSDTTNIDGDDYPEKGQVVASLGILF